MSIPPNQLAKYRSYSYYHVLAICDTSQTAAELAGETTTLDTWQHTPGDSPLGKYGIKKTATGGEYCILINGSMDADLTITKTSWTSLTASSATMNDRNTSIALEGQLSISEPRGVIFLNQIIQCCMALGVDSAHAFWVLKTFFVGFTYDGAQDTDGADFISDIPPVIFIAYDVTGSFTVQGGEYEISFLAAANSAARLPQYSKSAMAANIAPAGSVSDTLKALESAVQKNYDRYYDCVYAQTKANPSTVDIAPKLRKVKYIITCDPPYLDNGFYKTTDQSAQLKNFGPNCAPGAVTVPPGMSIDDAIYKIIDMSKEIKDEAAIGIGGKKYTTKIQNWLRSTQTTTKSGEKVIEYIVGYKLIRQEQPSSVSFDQVSGGTADLSSNLITFDYMYTGKNIDILELDLKMNMGMVYLQGATIQPQYKQPGQDAAFAASSVSPGDLRRSNSQNIPVLFGTQIKNSNIRDTKDASSTVQHAYTMTKHATLEALETNIKITGNPQLLGSINQTANPEFVASRVVQPNKEDGFARFSEWTTAPAFIKVNIKMPRNNNDESLFTGSQTSADSSSSSNDYAIDFWYQGYYYAYSIDHVFDNGEFYQTISALAIPEKSTFTSSEPMTPQKEVIDVDKLADECYENKFGCNDGTTNIGPPPQDNKKSTPFLPTTQDVHPNVTAASGSLWDQCVAASLKSGVPADLILAQYGQESGWGKSMSGKNNPFGIKSKKGEPGTNCVTHEVINGRRVVIRDNFRDYDSLSDALADHSKTVKRLAPGVTTAQTQEEMTNAVGRSKYATDPNYASSLYKIMQGRTFKKIKGGGVAPPQPKTQPQSTTITPRQNKDMLATTKNCGNTVDPQPQSTELSTADDCGVKVPVGNPPDTTTPTTTRSVSPTKKGPFVSNGVNLTDFRGLELEPKDDGFTLGTDKYANRIPVVSINDNPVPTIQSSPKTPPKFPRFL